MLNGQYLSSIQQLTAERAKEQTAKQGAPQRRSHAYMLADCVPVRCLQTVRLRGGGSRGKTRVLRHAHARRPVVVRVGCVLARAHAVVSCAHRRWPPRHVSPPRLPACRCVRIGVCGGKCLARYPLPVTLCARVGGSVLEERLQGLEAKVRECTQEIEYKSRQLSEAWQVRRRGAWGCSRPGGGAHLYCIMRQICPVMMRQS